MPSRSQRGEFHASSQLIFPTVLALSAIALRLRWYLAQIRHFKTVSAHLGSPQLTVSGTEVGLGGGASVVYTASADVTATANCVNGGGHKPSATNKNFSGALQSTATNQADANGKISTSLVLYALPVGFCPPGQSTVVTAATFSNVKLTDTTNGVTATIPGTFVFVGP